MSIMRNARALCVLASPEQNDLITSAFAASDVLDAVVIDNWDTGFETMLELHPVLAIVEDTEDKLDGVELVRTIRTSKRSPNIRIPIMLILNDATHKRVLAASTAGANRILTTPFNTQKCWQSIEDTLTDTRKFVETDDYVGPERRGGGGGTGYSGKNRRRR